MPFVRACRTPLLLLVGIAWLSQDKGLVANLVILQSSHNPFHAFFCAPPFHHECFFALPTSVLFVPNAVRLLVYFILLIAFLGLRGSALVPQRGSRQGVVVLTAFLIAAFPWFGLLHVEGLRMRLIPVLLFYTAAMWVFILVNIPLQAVERFFAGRRWATLFLEWTFPVSDVFFLRFHRRRIGSNNGWLQFLPTLSILAGLGLLLSQQVQLLTGGLPSEKMPIRVLNPQAAVRDQAGRWWYSDTIGTTAGLWVYDPSSTRARPVVRAKDLYSLLLKDGFLYLPDAFENVILKIDAGTGRVVWSTPIPSGIGTIQLSFEGESVFVVGTEGYVAALGLDGRRETERFLPFRADSSQALPGGRIATMAAHGPFFLRISSLRRGDDEAIPLPLSKGVLRPRSPQEIPILMGMEYVDSFKILYIATLWGEIFRFDVEGNRWLPSFWTSPGTESISTDGRNGLLFIYNHAQGVVTVMEGESGKTLAHSIAHVFGNSLSVSADAQVAVLSTHGPDSASVPQPGELYRLSYQTVVPFSPKAGIPLGAHLEVGDDS